MSDKYLTAYEKVLDRPSLKFMLGESKKREQELKADHVSKKALREWCEEKLKRLSILRSMDHNYFEKFSAELLDQFCKEGE